MTDEQFRRVSRHFRRANMRGVASTVNGCAIEASIGITSTRVVCGWRLIVTCKPVGNWSIVATPLLGVKCIRGYMPDGVMAAISCVALDTGIPVELVSDLDMGFDANNNKFHIAWESK